MPIIFISMSDTFTEKIKSCGFEAYNMKIQDYIPNDNKKHIMYHQQIVYVLWTAELIMH